MISQGNDPASKLRRRAMQEANEEMDKKYRMWRGTRWLVSERNMIASEIFNQMTQNRI